MSCSLCNSTPAPRSQVRRLVQQVQTGCTYSTSDLENWKFLLRCTKTKNLGSTFDLERTKLNSYIGIVQSALNYSTNPCYFKESLDKISPVVTQIKDSNLC